MQKCIIASKITPSSTQMYVGESLIIRTTYTDFISIKIENL